MCIFTSLPVTEKSYSHVFKHNILTGLVAQAKTTISGPLNIKKMTKKSECQSLLDELVHAG